MSPGDLVYVTMLGKKYVGIIESIDPEIPLTSQREAGDEDYYWVIIPETGNIKWEKGINLEIINNHLVH
tara:strand:+ start:55 stop:261 length:207 start_codon:yes stop_codon:yes gene_type:complete